MDRISRVCVFNYCWCPLRGSLYDIRVYDLRENEPRFSRMSLSPLLIDLAYSVNPIVWELALNPIVCSVHVLLSFRYSCATLCKRRMPLCPTARLSRVYTGLKWLNVNGRRSLLHRGHPQSSLFQVGHPHNVWWWGVKPNFLARYCVLIAFLLQSEILATPLGFMRLARSVENPSAGPVIWFRIFYIFYTLCYRCTHRQYLRWPDLGYVGREGKGEGEEKRKTGREGEAEIVPKTYYGSTSL